MQIYQEVDPIKMKVFMDTFTKIVELLMLAEALTIVGCTRYSGYFYTVPKIPTCLIWYILRSNHNHRRWSLCNRSSLWIVVIFQQLTSKRKTRRDGLEVQNALLLGCTILKRMIWWNAKVKVSAVLVQAVWKIFQKTTAWGGTKQLR